MISRLTAGVQAKEVQRAAAVCWVDVDVKEVTRREPGRRHGLQRKSGRVVPMLSAAKTMTDLKTLRQLHRLRAIEPHQCPE